MTTYLLDTHYLLWAIADSKKLSKKLRELLSDTDNNIVVSTISFWEVALKTSISKLKISGFNPEDLPELCQTIGFEIQSLSAQESSTYHQLQATHHKDPFDRMLIWLAIRNNYTLISADDDVKKYVSSGLKVYQEK